MKTSIKKIRPYIILLTTVFWLYNCKDSGSKVEADPGTQQESQKEVLLIGTFHYNNPGADVAKTKSFDILNDDSQQELDDIAHRISEFNPTKVFVEWEHDEQMQLDSLRKRYADNTYFTDDSLSDFYRKNEIFQLAFRAAKLGEIEEVIGFDYKTEFPFDSLMVVLEKHEQVDIQSRIGKMVEVFTSDFDEKIENGESLLDLTYYLNTEKFRAMSNRFHIEIPLLVGPKDNFIGPYLTSEWYRRNLYMWSLVQKSATDDDRRIMILAGASHAAMFKDFIDDNTVWSVVELKAVMEDN